MSLLGIPYLLIFCIFWRSLTGHFAWEVHRSAEKNRTIRPPVENWIGCAILVVPLAALWPIVLLFVIPWPWRRGAEKQAEIKLKGLEYQALLDSIAESEKRLEIGEVCD